MRRGTLLVGKAPIVLPAVGDAFMGGFFAGIMDSTQPGAIPASDASQTGQRYALIDLGAASESALAYKNADTAAPAACSTVWDGLSATKAMVAAGDSTVYPAAWYADGYSVPSDGASDPYIPAMWELLAMYWNFKPFTDNNYLGADSGSTFPGGTVTPGLDPAVDPQRPAFTTTVPGQTPLLPWRTGGAQSFQSTYYRTSTEYSATFAWSLYFGTAVPGRFYNVNKVGS